MGEGKEGIGGFLRGGKRDLTRGSHESKEGVRGRGRYKKS